MIDFRNVSLGLSLFLLQDGNHNKDYWSNLVSFILRTWSKYDQRLYLMMFEMYSCLLSFRSLSLVLKSLLLMFSINHNYLFSKLFNFQGHVFKKCSTSNLMENSYVCSHMKLNISKNCASSGTVTLIINSQGFSVFSNK
jgi:hypothetical protein